MGRPPGHAPASEPGGRPPIVYRGRVRVLASVLSLWAAYRWVGLAFGVARVRRFRDQARGEARRSCVVRTSWNVVWTVTASLSWVQALQLRPRPNTTGFASMLLILALLAAVTASFMQPRERTPETLWIFRLRPHDPGSAEREAGGDQEQQADR